MAKEKPPTFGMIRRTGEVMIRMPSDVEQVTLGPPIRGAITEGTVVYTDEYEIYSRLKWWGDDHRTVCHARGRYARGDDGDGFRDMHVNALERFWSLLRSRLRPRRGVLREKLPPDIGFLEFTHNVRALGKSILGSLMS